jgi:DNA invertase Pin-like site-specific DNA recombinase
MKYVAYYRVSTKKQGASGNGIEAQHAAVRSYVHGDDEIIAEYTDIESGSKADRRQLHKALDHCRQTGATLVIAKLDRLSRSAKFVFELRDSGVDFIACDMPEANTLTIGIIAVIAQNELETIRKRTKDALAARKERLKKEIRRGGLEEAFQAFMEIQGDACADDLDKIEAERRFQQLLTIKAQELQKQAVASTKDAKAKAAIKKIRTPKHYVMRAESGDFILNTEEVTMTHTKHAPSEEIRAMAYEALKEKARNNGNNIRAIEMIKNMNNVKSYREIARRLASKKFETSTGKTFTAVQVINLMKREGLTLRELQNA